MSDDTTKLLKACVEYRAMVDKLEAENAELREALSDDACREIMRLRSENAALRELTSTLGAPNHINIPVEKWRELSEDKERLDYMEKNVDFVSWMYYGKPHSWDFRGKIDARRKEAQP